MTTATSKRSKTAANADPSEDLQSAKDAALEAYRHLLDAKDKFKAAAIQAGLEAKEVTGERIDQTSEQAQVKAIDAVAESQSYIIDNPLTSVGIAFVSGYFFSKLTGK